MLKHKKEKLPRKRILIFVILAVFLIWLSLYLKVPKPNTYEISYDNQINNANLDDTVFSIGDGIYFSGGLDKTYLFCNEKAKRVPFKMLRGMESTDYFIMGDVAGYGSEMKLYSKQTGKLVETIEKNEKCKLTNEAVYYITGEYQNILCRYDILTGEVKTLVEKVADYKLLEEGKLLYTLEYSWSYSNKNIPIYLWDNGKKLELFKLPRTKESEKLMGFAYESGSIYFETDDDNEILKYDILTGEHQSIYNTHGKKFETVYKNKIYLTNTKLENTISLFVYDLKNDIESDIDLFSLKAFQEYDNIEDWHSNAGIELYVFNEDCIFFHANGMMFMYYKGNTSVMSYGY